MTAPLNLKEIERRAQGHQSYNACEDCVALLRALRETRTALRACVHTIQEEWGEDAAEQARAVLGSVVDD